ncbi:MAG: ChbG/HpnK family deacetylase [Planctomycetota bacterium]
MIINADDFGQTEGINGAVECAHKEGVLTSATIMANMPAAEDAIEIAKKLPELGVGVHLNLLEGKPVSGDDCVKVLTNSEGEFNFSPAKLAAAGMICRKCAGAIEAECDAQICRVLESGIQPTHLDSHKHVHSFPSIFRIVCRLAERFGIGAIRYTFEPGWASRKPWPGPAPKGRRNAFQIRLMARINRLQNPGFFRNEVLLGIAHTGKIDAEFFKAVAKCNKRYRVIEIMTHPGISAGLDPERTRLIEHRQRELEALCSKETKEVLKERFKLVHYGQLQQRD